MKKKKLKKLALAWAVAIEDSGYNAGEVLTTAVQVHRFLKKGIRAKKRKKKKESIG